MEARCPTGESFHSSPRRVDLILQLPTLAIPCSHALPLLQGLTMPAARSKLPKTFDQHQV